MTKSASDRLWEVAARWPHRVNSQALEHLTLALAQLSPEECYQTLSEPFHRRQGGADMAQEYAGRLLLTLRPPIPEPCGIEVARLLSGWDVSVEQLPQYLHATIGDELAAILGKLAAEGRVTSAVADTVLHWLSQGDLRCGGD